MNLVGEKGQKLRRKLDISGSQLTVSSVPATRLHSQVLIEERVFGQRPVWSKGCENTWGKMTNSHYLFIALSVPWHFYS